MVSELENLPAMVVVMEFKHERKSDLMHCLFLLAHLVEGAELFEFVGWRKCFYF